MTIDKVKKLVRDKGIEYFFCSFVEMSGAPKAKLVPATNLDEMASEGAGFAGFAAGDLGQGPHDPDIVSIPDFESLTILPWRKNVAWVPGNLHVDGKSWDHCPRTILTRQIEKARQKGYIFNVGVEPEFMLLKKKPNGRIRALGFAGHAGEALLRHARAVSQPGRDDHAALAYAGVGLGPVCQRSRGRQLPVRNQLGIFGCAAHRRSPYVLQMDGANRGRSPWLVGDVHAQTFFSSDRQWRAFSHEPGRCGNEQECVSAIPADPLGLSQIGRWFMGGVLHHAEALAAITAPLVNSYKRLIRGAPRSGATWAPVYVTYGRANRTQMIRIPGPGRIENRTVDGAANPYLACAVLLAAGLDGIENKIDPGADEPR